jgi:predicted DNA-binding transcriptional regulator AlpA
MVKIFLNHELTLLRRRDSMMNKEVKKKAITPAELEAIYGIPRGSSANMRWAKKGPKYYKAGPRRVIYMVEDVEEWLSRNPVQTIDSLEGEN